MYLRRDRQKKKGKEPATYLSIAHNVVEKTAKGRRAKPVVLASLGNEEDLDAKMVSQLIRSLEKYAYERWGTKPNAAAVKQVARELRPQSASLRVVCSKNLGMRLLVEAAWKALGIDRALKSFARKRRVEFDFERVVFAMVVNRIVDPKSKYACNRWVQRDAYFPEAADWQVQHFYRSLDVLHDHWESLEDHLAHELWSLLTEEEKAVLLTDTTTLYFEARQNDAEIAALDAAWEAADGSLDVPDPKRRRPRLVNHPPFRLQGHNKDGHPGDPQVVIASVCTPGGFVLRHRTYPGNTSDFTVARDLIPLLPHQFPRVKRIWVSDAGMLAKDHVAALDAARWDRLSAEGPRRSGMARKLFSLATPGKYKSHTRKPHLGFKVVDLAAEDSPSGKAERWVISRNEREHERQLERIERHLDTVSVMLARQAAAGNGHPRSVCNVVSHPSLRRYVMASTKVKGTYILDQEAIRRAKQMAGVRFIRTTKLDWDAERIFDTYQALQDVEANHKLFKGPLRLQPCYHQTTARIQAHIMLTILAGNCVRYLERATGLGFNQLLERFKPLVAVRKADGKEEFWQRSDLTPEQLEVLKMLKIQSPPEVWDEWIELKRAKLPGLKPAPVDKKRAK